MMLENLENRREEIEIVNESVSTTSTMEYVSPRKRYVMYEKPSVRINLSKVKKLLEEGPKYLVEDETEFLEQFLHTFESSKTHSGYNVDPKDFMELVVSGINALTSRIHSERGRVLEKGGKTGERIQYLFYNIFDFLSELKKDILNNFDLYTQDPREFLDKKKMVLEGSEILAKTYIYEFIFLSGEEISRLEIDESITKIADLWKMRKGGIEIAYS